MKIILACLLLASSSGLLEAQVPPPTIPWQVGPPGPGFTWLSSRSASGVPLLAFEYKGVNHVAVLEHYDPVPEVHSKSELCIFKGFLEKDPKSEVLVTGCPNSKSFDISINGPNFEGFRFNVENGVGKTLRSPLGTPIINRDGSAGIFRDYAIPSGQFPPFGNRSSSREAVPAAGFIFKIAIIYDRSWLAKYVTNAEAESRIKAVVANAQTIFNWPSLTFPIQLQVASITYQPIDIPANGTGLKNLVPFATDNTIQSYVGFSNIGQNGGIGYQPGICGTMAYRSAVVKTGWWSDQITGEIMAHELGHNLGMNHDFIDPYTSPKTPYLDSKGASCTDSNGVMDYYVTVQKWTTCSVERFTSNYNQVIAERGTFCLPTIGGSNETPALKLAGGSSPSEGKLFATNPSTKSFGPVCDDNFADNLNGANVVCKQLGYPAGAASVECCSSRGRVSTNFAYDNVKCTGTEATLDACPHANAHDCGSNEGVWIVCNSAAG